MAKNKIANMRRSKSDMVPSCMFCLIAHGYDKKPEIIQKNNELVCFRDINPAAPHHYLVIPKEHIWSCFSMHRGHIDLVERMVEMGKAVLRDQGVTEMKDIRLGFHKPPYISVNHLHLHVIAPASQILKSLEYKFIPETDSFVTESRLRDRLKHIPPSTHSFLGCCVQSSHKSL